MAAGRVPMSTPRNFKLTHYPFSSDSDQYPEGNRPAKPQGLVHCAVSSLSRPPTSPLFSSFLGRETEETSNIHTASTFFSSSFSTGYRPETPNSPRPGANLESDPSIPPPTPAPTAPPPPCPSPPNPPPIPPPKPPARSAGLRHKTLRHPRNPKRNKHLSPHTKSPRLFDFASQRRQPRPLPSPHAQSLQSPPRRNHSSHSGIMDRSE